MLPVVLDDFLNDELQEAFGEFGVQVSRACQFFQSCDLAGLPVGVRGRKVMFGLQFAHGLGVLEPLAQSVDKDGIQTVDAFAVFLQDFRGACGGVSQWASPSV